MRTAPPPSSLSAASLRLSASDAALASFGQRLALDVVALGLVDLGLEACLPDRLGLHVGSDARLFRLLRLGLEAGQLVRLCPLGQLELAFLGEILSGDAARLHLADQLWAGTASRPGGGRRR